MTDNLETQLPTTLADLADAPPPPPGLAAAAIRTARRRRRTQLAVAGLAVVAAAAAGTMAAVSTLSPEPAATPFAAASQPLAPLVVTAYSGIQPDDLEIDSPESSLLLDPTTGDYLELPYAGVVPSPDGERALIYTGDNSPQAPLRVGVFERATGEVRWIDGYSGNGNTSTGAWSPDGRELLITEWTRLGEPGFVIVDVETLDTTFVPHDDLDDPAVNSMGLRFVWTPDGDIALTESTSAGDEAQPDQVSGIRIYDRDGELLRVMPAAAALTGESGFSPTGELIALQVGWSSELIQVVDADSGEILHEVTAPEGVVVGWADEERLVVSDGRTLSVVDLTGQVIEEVPLRDGHWVAQVHVGPSDRLPDDAAELTFGTD